MLTLDTSDILATLNAHDSHHTRALAALQADNAQFIVPAGIRTEVAYMIEVRLGAGVSDALLGELEEGAFTLDATRAICLGYEFWLLAVGISQLAMPTQRSSPVSSATEAAC